MLFFSLDRERIVRRLCRRLAAAGIFLCCVFWTTLSICQASGRILCNRGDGNFDAEFRTGVKVHVGAARNGELGTRACAAKLSWDKQEFVVATGVAQLDLDAFGVDLGDGVATAAFQIKKSDAECCMEYRIYSLEKPPRLLRTITGGGFYSACDIDLDGRVAIWTTDAAALNGFENLALSELDSAPSVVFRFVHGQLLDVSAEFRPHFDDAIARIRVGMRSQDLEDFKASDGKLTTTPSISAERLHHLRMVKIKVLELVWAYLYSGREQDAWRSLAEMWPPADTDRIHAALVSARAHGIHSQADGTSAGSPRRRQRRAHIFDAVSRSAPGSKLEVIPPTAILLLRPPVSEIQQRGTAPELFLDLVIDEAGKVRSAESTGNRKDVDSDLINAALNWKFIPAFKEDQPVASRLRLAVAPRQ